MCRGKRWKRSAEEVEIMESDWLVAFENIYVLLGTSVTSPKGAKERIQIPRKIMQNSNHSSTTLLCASQPLRKMAARDRLQTEKRPSPNPISGKLLARANSGGGGAASYLVMRSEANARDARGQHSLC